MIIRDLCFKYDDKEIFDHLNLDLSDDRIYLMGVSGIGKSSLLKLIAGLLKPDSGYIKHDYKKIAIMFQEDRLLPWLNVKDNLLLVCDQIDKVDWILNEIEIDGNLMVDELSGGMARRVSLARAILYDGDLLLLDEPFSGMDKDLKEKMANLILSRGKKLIISGHDDKEAKLLKAGIVNI